MGRAIVRKPQVFLMDEPLSNLDAKLRVQTRTQIASLQRRLGVTTVYVTHDQTEAMTMGDRICVLKDGLLQQVGTPRDLYDHPNNVFVAGFIGSPAMNLLDLPTTDGGIKLGDTVWPVEREACRPPPAARSRSGMRPEDLVIERARARGRVDVVEELGADAYIYGHAVGDAGPADHRPHRRSQAPGQGRHGALHADAEPRPPVRHRHRRAPRRPEPGDGHRRSSCVRGPVGRASVSPAPRTHRHPAALAVRVVPSPDPGFTARWCRRRPAPGRMATMSTNMAITAAAPDPALLDLPWQTPLEDWPESLLAALPRGISRHTVRFVKLSNGVLAVKEIDGDLAEREYGLLRLLRRIGMPAVEPVGVVSGRTAPDGEPIESALVTRHLQFSLPYRALFSQSLRTDTATRLVDALAVLLVRLHLNGFYWGDVSLSNALFRRDAGAFAAYLVDAETGETCTRTSRAGSASTTSSWPASTSPASAWTCRPAAASTRASTPSSWRQQLTSTATGRCGPSSPSPSRSSAASGGGSTPGSVG